MKLVWTAEALDDVRRLHKFLAAKSPEAARRAVGAIRTGMKTVVLQPGAGRHADKAAKPEERDWLIGFGASGYVVRYRLEGESITVLAVWHQREAGLRP